MVGGRRKGLLQRGDRIASKQIPVPLVDGRDNKLRLLSGIVEIVFLHQRAVEVGVILSVLFEHQRLWTFENIDGTGWCQAGAKEGEKRGVRSIKPHLIAKRATQRGKLRRLVLVTVLTSGNQIQMRPGSDVTTTRISCPTQASASEMPSSTGPRPGYEVEHSSVLNRSPALVRP